jgi:hypothetical protein
VIEIPDDCCPKCGASGFSDYTTWETLWKDYSYRGPLQGPIKKVRSKRFWWCRSCNYTNYVDKSEFVTEDPHPDDDD